MRSGLRAVLLDGEKQDCFSMYPFFPPRFSLLFCLLNSSKTFIMTLSPSHPPFPVSKFGELEPFENQHCCSLDHSPCTAHTMVKMYVGMRDPDVLGDDTNALGPLRCWQDTV